MTEVLVVHCIDTEGPLGGDARRLPDGSAEFFDNWSDIVESLAELTSDAFREAHADSFGGTYRFNWFILDFTGFRTNPKPRIAAYHDTYDHLRALPTESDALLWHYHVPPASGIGDQWSDSWLTSNEGNTILARRLLERGDFPEAYRAGGTIEDDAASAWLEEVFLLDFSNRVSARSVPGADLFHFNWYGAPAVWGSYHPSRASFLEPGSMRRFVYRSLDLRSRYNVVDSDVVRACFDEVARTGEPRVLSYFSHDNRDMRVETHDAYRDLVAVSAATGVPWRSCTAVEAHRHYHGLAPQPVELHVRQDADGRPFEVAASGPIFQRAPFTAAELHDGRYVRLFPSSDGELRWRLSVDPAAVSRLGVAATSPAGDKAVHIWERT